MVKITERGWGGHYCMASRCRFRRNTLIEKGDDKIVVSTVGNMHINHNLAMETIGNNRFYETMVFRAALKNGYWDADVSEPIDFDSPWSICGDSEEDLPDDVDNVANCMHETVVNEIKR